MNFNYESGMKYDIILSGVGGQGILSIATIIADAAVAAGLQLKQAEVHGMSQRGGEVESGLRLSDSVIFSDLLSSGSADMILSMEPMEALRYLPFLAKDGYIVTSTAPFRNIPDYPEEAVRSAYKVLPNTVGIDIEALARDNSMPRSANMILLGAAARHIGILTPEQLKESIRSVFGRKGAQVVETNLRAFDIGMDAIL